MNLRNCLTGRKAQTVLILSTALCGGGSPAKAQLAITEVMSSAAETFQQTNIIAQASDWWELTNFGTNAAQKVDLAGYKFTDGRGSDPVLLVQGGDPPLALGPGQSVVFVRTRGTVDYGQFTNWWGELIDPQVPVRFYGRSPGFNSMYGDGVRLLDPADNLVDSVNFGMAESGLTFISDTNGEFGVVSSPGVCGAGWAATADDLGSPGVACGPVPLRFMEQPTNRIAAAGTRVVLSARAAGLPRPRYQWFFNGQPMPDNVSRALIISSVRPEDAGLYEVEISNYFGALRSAPVQLIVSTNPSPPAILSPPRDMTFLAGMNARFSIEASCYPPSSFQWFSNNVPLPDETNPTLLIPNCQPPMSGAEFCVRVTNALGSTNVCAKATVIPRPNIELTEAMASALSGYGHESWFELTNFDTNEVNLLGWRFGDNIEIGFAFTVTQRVTITPGESVVFVKRLSREEFARWWGADNLPPRTKISTFEGFGLGPGNAVYFWPAGAEDAVQDLFATYSFDVFPPGVSLWLDSTNHPFGWPSEPGVRGAFQAVESPDIGSPGYLAAPPLELISIQRTPPDTNLKWRSIPGRRYQLQFKDSLAAASWSPGGTYVATNATVEARDPTAAGSSRRFYRVQEVP